jgi:hypothetical protein
VCIAQVGLHLAVTQARAKPLAETFNKILLRDRDGSLAPFASETELSQPNDQEESPKDTQCILLRQSDGNLRQLYR